MNITIYYLFIMKYLFQFHREKICSIHYLDFAFEKHVSSQVFKDLSVENIETTPRSIDLELLIIEVVF